MFSINESEYTQMTDEKLIENIKQEDTKALDCLLQRYNETVSMKANRFFMVGAEKEDMITALLAEYKLSTLAPTTPHIEEMLIIVAFSLPTISFAKT